MGRYCWWNRTEGLLEKPGARAQKILARGSAGAHVKHLEKRTQVKSET